VLIRLLRSVLARWQRLGRRRLETAAVGVLNHPIDTAAIDYLNAHTLRQPDGTTCGSASLVFAQMLIDPNYASKIIDDRRTPLITDTAQQRFAAEAQRVHQETNAVTDADAALQLPWPKSLGTLPWAAARQMNIALTGAGYQVLLIDPARSNDAFARIRIAVARGYPAPLYIGDALSPRHIVLAVSAADESITVYEPSGGTLCPITADTFSGNHLDVAGWDQPWLAVLPA
jgi:hypothetical protein